MRVAVIDAQEAPQKVINRPQRRSELSVQSEELLVNLFENPGKVAAIELEEDQSFRGVAIALHRAHTRLADANPDMAEYNLDCWEVERTAYAKFAEKEED